MHRTSALALVLVLGVAGALLSSCGGTSPLTVSPAALPSGDLTAEPEVGSTSPESDEPVIAGPLEEATGWERSTRGASTEKNNVARSRATPRRADANLRAPKALALPFAVPDIVPTGFFSPFGVVRWSLDRPEYGHSGIDVPLRHGAPLYAVADGVILAVTPSIDHRPGSIVTLLFEGRWPAGEGWAFLYEHVELMEGLAEGSRVRRGQEIAWTPLHPHEANNHLQLSYLFIAHAYTREHYCCVEQLRDEDQTAFLVRFDAIRASDTFHRSWETAREEDALVYRALLDETAFPRGPALCYPQGTDVRESLHVLSP